MLRIPTPFPDTTLLLAPRWGELSAAAQISLLALCCLVPFLLAILLYRFELRLVRRGAAAALLALRLAALGFLLLVFCFRPVLAHTVTEHLPGRVLVALDRSLSMDVADPQRPLLDKLRLARALRLGEGLCTPQQLDDWIRAYETADGPQWLRADESPNDPERRRQLAEERRRPHDEVARRIDALTRAATARRIVEPEGIGLLAAIGARHKVEVLAFARDAWDIPPEAAGTAAAASTPEAELRGTDLRLALTRALQTTGPDEGRILGVVLLTDGQHNHGPSPIAKALELGEHGLPVYPIALGPRQAPPDVALAAVKAPASVFKGVDAPIETRVKVSGLPAQEIVVELQAPGQPVQEEHIRHDGGDRYYPVRFQVRLDQVGTQALTVTARSVAGETRTDNNSRPLAVNVADDRAKVLLVDGEARWEYHYLASALHRDRSVETHGVVFAQPRLGRIPEEELHKVGNPRLHLPPEADALAGYDCIIVGDVTPAQLPPPDRVRLERYVADRGGTLVLVAGKRAMPQAFLGDGDDPLPRLLPIEEPQVVTPAAGFPMTLTPEGRLAAFLQLEAAPDRSEQRWAELPRHFWGVVGRVKPGAVPLAALVEGDARPSAAPERERALVARHNYGFGRVLFVGVDSTWRWRFRTGDAYHHRFWGQVIRWAASDKPLVAGNDHVRFGTREPAYRQGQEVELVVRLGDSVSPLRADGLAGARILRRTAEGKEEAVALVPLDRREAQPRVLEGRVRDLPAGQYAVELAIPELGDLLQGPPGPDGTPAPLRATFAVTPPDSEETVELAANWPLLEEVASKSGGRVFAPEEAAALVDLLTQRSSIREHLQENKLWQWWGTLAVCLLLLTAEWVGRKWVGLP